MCLWRDLNQDDDIVENLKRLLMKTLKMIKKMKLCGYERLYKISDSKTLL